MRRAWLALSLVACASPPRIIAEPMAIVAAAPEEDLDAATVVARMTSAYATATTYSDHGTYVLDHGQTLESSFRTVFVRDRRLSYTLSDNSHQSLKVWTDFQHTYSDSQFGSWLVDDEIRVDRPFRYVIGPQTVALTSLLPGIAYESRRSMFATPVRAGSELVSGHDCWVVTGLDAQGEMSLWIDKATYMIRRVREDIRSDNGSMTSTTEFEPVLNAPIDIGTVPPPKDFAKAPARTPEPPDPSLGFDTDYKPPVVRMVFPRSSAAKVGIMTGDLVTALDGKAVSSGLDLHMPARMKALGTKFVVTVERAGETKELTVATEISPIDQAAFDAERMVNTSAPAFDLAVVAGTQVEKLDQLKGHVVLLDFWAQWCEACVETFSMLERLARQNPGLRIISISPDAPEVIRGQANGKDAAFTFVSDPDGKAFAAYHVASLPHYVLVDRAGVIRYVGGGIRNALPLLVRTLLRQ